MKIHFYFYEHLRMINRYRDKHILEMCMDMVYVCVHKDVCWLPVLLFACQQ